MEEKSPFKIPERLVSALIHAREEGNDEEFQKTLTDHATECKKKGLELPSWWLRLLEGLAQRKTLIQIANELELNPYGFVCLNFLNNLEEQGFPKGFLEELIEKAKPEIGEVRI
jgi:hypothetical protein